MTKTVVASEWAELDADQYDIVQDASVTSCGSAPLSAPLLLRERSVRGHGGLRRYLVPPL